MNNHGDGRISAGEQRLEQGQDDLGATLDTYLATQRLTEATLRSGLGEQRALVEEARLAEDLRGPRGVFGPAEVQTPAWIVMHDDLAARREEGVEKRRHAPGAPAGEHDVVHVAVKHELPGLGGQVTITKLPHERGQVLGAGQIDEVGVGLLGEHGGHLQAGAH